MSFFFTLAPAGATVAERYKSACKQVVDYYSNMAELRYNYQHDEWYSVFKDGSVAVATTPVYLSSAVQAMAVYSKDELLDQEEVLSRLEQSETFTRAVQMPSNEG